VILQWNPGRRGKEETTATFFFFKLKDVADSLLATQYNHWQSKWGIGSAAPALDSF